MTVLILTSDDDVTADLVIDQLTQRRVPVLRLDPADYPAKISVSTLITGGSCRTRIDTGRATLDLEEVRSVWLRRPGPPGQGIAVQPEWSAMECERHLWGALRTIPAGRWMNHPDAAERHRYKIWQLRLAQDVGLTVPRTLVSNDPVEAVRFARPGDALIGKAVSGQHPEDPPLTIPAVRLPAGIDFGPVADCATCLQQEINKSADIRLTIVGRTMFACEIVAADQVLDWRWEAPEDCTWRPVTVPRHIARAARRYMQAARLAYGAMDFAVDTAGAWQYLECNQGGQFGFVEIHTGMPIAAAIAGWLAAPRRGR